MILISQFRYLKNKSLVKRAMITILNNLELKLKTNL